MTEKLDENIVHSKFPPVHVPLVSIGEYIIGCLNKFDQDKVILVRTNFISRFSFLIHFKIVDRCSN
jgi:hypothetical protein